MRARGQNWKHLSPDARRRILRQPVDVLLSTVPRTHIPLSIDQAVPVTMMNASDSVAHFYLMNDGQIGVLALGSFQDSDFKEFGLRLLSGLLELKSRGATKLVIDVVCPCALVAVSLILTASQTNNGGGFVCIAQVRYSLSQAPFNCRLMDERPQVAA